MKLLLLPTLLLCCSSAFGTGFTTKGGGFTYQGRLLDLVEAERQGIQFIQKPHQLPGFAEVVHPTIQRIKQKLPRFAADLEEIAKRRIWRFVAISLPHPEASGSPLESRICGAVDEKYFSVLKPCFDDVKGAKEKGYFLLHELVRQIGLQSGASQNDVQEIIQILVLFPEIEAELLQSTLSKSNFGTYLTLEEIKTSGAPLSHYSRALPTIGRKFDAVTVHREMYGTDIVKEREASLAYSQLFGRTSDGHDYHGIIQCYNYLSHFMGRLNTSEGTRYACCYFSEGSNILSARVEKISKTCSSGELSLNPKQLADSMWNFGSQLKGVNIENTIRATLESGAIPQGTQVPRSY